MNSTALSVIGTLLGVIVGAALQHFQARRDRRWREEESFRNAKRAAYVQYLRSISASYAQARSGQRTRTEDGKLYAATAEIEILSDNEISGPAWALADKVIEVHSRIANGPGVEESVINEVDQNRYALIDRFKADIKPGASGARS